VGEAEQAPQLTMRREDLGALPPVELPQGYRLVHYRPGDGKQWDEIIRDAFDIPEPDFEHAIKAHPSFRPERVWFVAQENGRKVATACLVVPEPKAKSGGPVRPDQASSEQASDPSSPGATERIGLLHMVGVRRAHQGLRLGYAVCLGALHQMAAEGLDAAELGTDAPKLPAIKTYLHLGLEPVLVHESHRRQWRAVFKALGRAEELERRFGAILDGPVRRSS